MDWSIGPRFSNEFRLHYWYFFQFLIKILNQVHPEVTVYFTEDKKFLKVEKDRVKKPIKGITQIS